MEYNVRSFKKLLLEENKKQNLISRRNPEIEIEKHIEDSMRALEFLDFNEKQIVDIGSGAGFPGLILAIMAPSGQFTLVEADGKKSGFLNRVKEELQLANVNLINQRVEILGQDQQYRGRFDYCTSRAVAAGRVILEYSLPLLTMGGSVIMWKGRNYQMEMEEAGQALIILGGEWKTVYNYNLMDELDRALVVVEKARKTPGKYPRRNGVPAKKPL